MLRRSDGDNLPALIASLGTKIDYPVGSLDHVEVVFDDNERAARVDQGNTVLVIEHNLDVIKTADWIIDLGPEGGSGGGLVVAEGSPEDVATVEASHTGRFLRDMIGL